MELAVQVILLHALFTCVESHVESHVEALLLVRHQQPASDVKRTLSDKALEGVVKGGRSNMSRSPVITVKSRGEVTIV